MADNHFESGGEERVWDEYDWERFLQQQDRKTEKYMELLEKYIDDPNRDQIIAREMGWHHSARRKRQGLERQPGHPLCPAGRRKHQQGRGRTRKRTTTSTRTRISTRTRSSRTSPTRKNSMPDADEEEDEPEDRYSQHPLYQAASALAVYVDRLFSDNESRRAASRGRPVDDQRHPGQRQARRRPHRRRRGRTRHDDRLSQAGAQGRSPTPWRPPPSARRSSSSIPCRRRTCGDAFSRCAMASCRSWALPQRMATPLRAGALSAAAPQPVGGASSIILVGCLRFFHFY